MYMMVTFIKCIMYNSLLTTCVFSLRCIICLNYVVNLLFTPYLAMAIVKLTRLGSYTRSG